MSIFEANSAQLRDLYAAIKDAFRHRNEGEPERKAWQEACRRFHASYDALAFPGGIGNAMLLLEKNDPATVEMVVRFLEADPRYFRSGYHKEFMMQHLRKATLTEDQRKRLQQVILARIQDRKTPREFRRYCHLARVVSDAVFEQKVSDLAGSSDPDRSRHAQWVLKQLRSG